MWKWFKSLFSRKSEAELIDIGGVEPDLDEWSLEQREECIQRIVESGKTLEEATRLADSWTIMTVHAHIGDKPARLKYVPCPIWDWDWMWRPMFDTREEAEAHVESKRGALFDADPES